jgi:hypothetical protein
MRTKQATISLIKHGPYIFQSLVDKIESEMPLKKIIGWETKITREFMYPIIKEKKEMAKHFSQHGLDKNLGKNTDKMRNKHIHGIRIPI